MRNQKGPVHQSMLELTEQIGVITLTDFKMHSEIIVIKSLWHWLKTDTWDTETEIIIHALITNCPVSSLLRAHSVRKGQSLSYMALKTWMAVQQNEIQPYLKANGNQFIQD